MFISVACKKEVTRIKCDDDKVIKVTYATYGRSDTSTCPSDNPAQNANVTCTVDVTKDLGDKCNGSKTCRQRVNNKKLGTPCKNTALYLTYQYECTDPSKEDVSL